MFAFSLSLIVAYFLGAIPFGYLVARAKGVNIFEVGSKNPGATNVLRTLGKGPGYTVFALDALKGALATVWVLVIPSLGWGEEGHLVYCQLLGLVGALLGHSFSCFTGFKGGKGVATASGGFLVLLPLATLLGGVVWALTFFTSRYVSLASICAALALPVAALFLGSAPVLVAVAGVIGALVVLRHRANIGRLLQGTENRFVRKSTTNGK